MKCNLYLISCYGNNEMFVKIGVTSNEVKRRFDSPYGGSRKMPYWYDIKFLTRGDSKRIIDCEEYIREMFKSHRYTPSIKFCGYLECYNKERMDDIIDGIHYFLGK